MVKNIVIGLLVFDLIFKVVLICLLRLCFLSRENIVVVLVELIIVLIKIFCNRFRLNSYIVSKLVSKVVIVIFKVVREIEG